MRNNLEMKNKQSGFTLIEIAIVMVIIGLLIGGVLKGQALIDNAKIKSVVNDIKGVQAAYYGYLDRSHTYTHGDTVYTTLTNTAGHFFFDTRTAGLINGDILATAPPLNGMGGALGVQVSPMGLAGDAVCTSVPTKFAAGIDATLDDGTGTGGTMYGFSSATLSDATITTATAANAYPVAVTPGTDDYTVLCMTL